MSSGGSIQLRLSLKGAEQVRADLERLGPAGQRSMRVLDRAMREPGAGLRALNTASGELTRGLDNAAARAGPFGQVVRQLGPWGLAAAAAVGALAAAAAAFYASTRQSMQWADDLETTADRIGISVEALQRWSHVAGEADVATATLHANMERLNGMVGAFKAGIGDGRIKPIFEELGITEAQLRNVQTAEQMMLLLADTLGQVEDRAIQVRLARGLGVEESLPILRMGAEQVRQLLGAAADLGTVVDTKTVKALADANRQMEIAGSQMKALATQAAAPLAAILGDAAEQAGQFMAQMNQMSIRAPDWARALALVADAIPFARGSGSALAALIGATRPKDSAAQDSEDILKRLRAGGGFELQGHGSGAAAAAAAARQAEQRRRALEDIEQMLALEEARLRGEQDRVRELERQRDLTQMIRRLEDLGVPAAEARTRAAAGQARLDAARQDSMTRQRRELEAQTYLEIARAEEAWNVVRALERDEEVRKRIVAYQATQLDLEEATAAALADQAQLDDARSRAMGRWLDESARAYEIELARLRGDRERVRLLERAHYIQERSQALQQQGGLDPNTADRKAADEAEQLERARVYGIFREGVSGALAALRRNEFDDYFLRLADRFASRLEDRLAEQLTPLFMHLAELMLGGGKGGGGGFLSEFFGHLGFGPVGGGAKPGAAGAAGGSGFSFKGGFFGPRAAWGGVLGGGRTAVGERGLEVVDLPPGSRVFDHEASLRMLRAERRPPPPGGGGAGAGAGNAASGPVIGKFEIHNHGGEPMTARVRQAPNGDMRADLYPLGAAMIEQAGRDGTLAKALGKSPQPRRR